MRDLKNAELRAKRRERLNRETREIIESARFGEDASCWLCSESDRAALEWLGQPFVQEHHVAGKHHDRKLKWPVCANCHRRLHALLRDRDVPLRRQQSIIETVTAVLEALAVFFEVFVQSLRKFAIQMREAIRLFDAAGIDWRSIVRGAA